MRHEPNLYARTQDDDVASVITYYGNSFLFTYYQFRSYTTNGNVFILLCTISFTVQQTFLKMYKQTTIFLPIEKRFVRTAFCTTAI